jgi:plasmid stabilization system protein ParE
MNILWSANAKQRLVEILDYISGDNPEAVLSLIDLIEASASKLIQTPLAGRQIPEYQAQPFVN